MGFEPAGGAAADFAQAIERDSQKWSKVIKDAGVKAE
jgi:tripartite-type tricarboxylate transporter receptor subunit TctC